MALSLLVALAVFSLVAVGYGWVPLSGSEIIEPFLGEVPEGFVAWYGTGWGDHQFYFVFKADSDLIERVARRRRLEDTGEMKRGECMDRLSPPWWFDLAPWTLGTCWKRLDGMGSEMMLHFVPSTGDVFLLDWSS